MPKFNIDLDGEKGGGGKEVSFGGKRGDKYKVRVPAGQEKKLHFGADGVARAESISGDETREPEGGVRPDRSDEQDWVAGLGGAEGFAIGDDASGPRVIGTPGDYHFGDISDSAIGDRASVAGNTRSEVVPAKGAQRLNVPKAPQVSKLTQNAQPASLEQGLGSRIIGKFSNMKSLIALGNSIGFEVNDKGRMAYAREVNRLAKLAANDLELYQKLEEVLMG